MIDNYDDRYLQSFDYETTVNSDGIVAGTCELGKAEIQLINDSNEYSTLKGQWIHTIHGSFYVDSIEPVQEKVNIKLICKDIKYKLDTKYDSSLYTWPMTLKQWRNAIFTNCDVSYDDSDFPNSSIILNSEPYIGENPSNRNVISQIAQAGCSFVITDENDIFYFRWFSSTIHNASDWLELTTEKESTNQINVVILGRGNVEDNVFWPENKPTNPVEFRIDNNYILDPQVEGEDKRYDVIENIYNRVNGFSYLIFNMRTQFISNKLNIKLGEKINYVDIWGNNLSAYIMTKKITWLGGDPTNPDNYEIVLSAEEIKETSTELSYGASIKNDLLRVERKADKNTGKIEDIVEVQSSQEGKISRLEINQDSIQQSVTNTRNQLTELSSITNTIKGNSPLKIENAIKSTLHSLKIKGDSEVSDSKLRVYSKNEEVDGTEIELNYNPKSKNLFDIDYYSNVDNYINDTNNYCCHLTNLPKTRLYVKCELIGEEQSGLYFRIGNTPSQTAESLYASIIQNGACRSFNVDTSSWENIYLRYYTKDFDISKLKENYRIMISTDDINWIPYDEHGGMYYLGKNLFDVNTATKSYGNFEQTINNGILTLTATGTLGAQFSQVILKNLNASKSYCLSFKAKKTSLGQDGRPYIQIVIYGSSDGSTYRWLYNVVETNPTLNQEYSFSKLGITGYSSYRFYIYNNTGTPVTIGEQTKYYDILFKEGDEITPYEPYAFSTQETRSGKNLFDIDEWLSSRGAIYEKQNNVYKIANTSQLYSNKYQLNLKPNTIYSLSNKYYKQDSTNIMIEIFENDTRIGYIVSSNDQKNYYTFTTDSSSSYYVRLNYTTRVYPVVFDSVMLSEGTEITSYEPYGVSPSPDYPSPIINKYPAGKYKTIIDDKIYTFELTDDLRSVPGVRDELWLDIENMKLEINRKVGNVVLDGSENWNEPTNGGLSSCVNKYFANRNTENKAKDTSKLLCDYFIQGTIWSNDIIGINYEESAVSKSVRIRTSQQNLNDFKSWLSTHNTTVYYELAEQITEEQDITVIYQEYNLNINELYSLNDTNDEFVDLNGQALITKKIGIKNNDTKYELEEPMVSDLGNIFINLLDGVNIIEFEDGFELEVVYFIDNELTRAFLSTSTSNKEQSEQRETIEQNSSDISNISANLNNNYKNNSQLNQLLEQQRQEILTEQNVTMTQTKEQWALEVLQRLNSEGIEKLKNMLVAIDINGINVSKSDEDVVSLLNNLGLYVSDGKLKEDLSNLLMKADRSGAYFKMIEILLTIKEQGIIQKEKINHPKYGICQAHYWIGG